MSDEELIYVVIAAIQDSNLGHCHQTERCGYEWGHTKDAAEAVLAALAGRLLPPVVETREEWGRPVLAPTPGVSPCAPGDAWYCAKEPEQHRIRTVTKHADGSEHFGPWCEVSP